MRWLAAPALAVLVGACSTPASSGQGAAADVAEVVGDVGAADADAAQDNADATADADAVSDADTVADAVSDAATDVATDADTAEPTTDIGPDPDATVCQSAVTSISQMPSSALAVDFETCQTCACCAPGGAYPTDMAPDCLTCASTSALADAGITAQGGMLTTMVTTLNPAVQFFGFRPRFGAVMASVEVVVSDANVALDEVRVVFSVP